MSTITTTELRDAIDRPDLTIVDVRTLAAYNGWRRNAEARGGHVPNAVSFPVAWLRTVDAVEVERLLSTKGVTGGNEVVVIGDGDVDAEAVASRIRELGVPSVRTLEGGARAWAADPSLPLETLPKYTQLVHIPWLRDALAGERRPRPPRGTRPKSTRRSPIPGGGAPLGGASAPSPHQRRLPPSPTSSRAPGRNPGGPTPGPPNPPTEMGGGTPPIGTAGRLR